MKKKKEKGTLAQAVEMNPTEPGDRTQEAQPHTQKTEGKAAQTHMVGVKTTVNGKKGKTRKEKHKQKIRNPANHDTQVKKK